MYQATTRVIFHLQHLFFCFCVFSSRGIVFFLRRSRRFRVLVTGSWRFLFLFFVCSRCVLLEIRLLNKVLQAALKVCNVFSLWCNRTFIFLLCDGQLLTKNRDLLRRINSKTNTIRCTLNDRDTDAIPDQDTFVKSASQKLL